MTLRYTDMDYKDALYKIARKYPGGVSALAHRMGTTEPMMYNKLRPSINTHYTSIDEFSEVIEFCRDAGVPDALLPLHALNWQHGLVANPVPIGTDRSDSELENCVVRVLKEIGDIAAVQQSAMADQKITTAELDQIERQFQEGFEALAEWRQRIRRRYASQPAGDRA